MIARLKLPILLIVGVLYIGETKALDVTVSLQGKVVDLQGKALAGARIDLLETSITATSGSDGTFHLSGTFQTGLVRRAVMPGGGRLGFRKGRLILSPPPGEALDLLLISPAGRTRSMRLPAGSGERDLEAWLGTGAGMHFLRVGKDAQARTFRLIRPGHGSPLQLWAGMALAQGSNEVRLAKAAVDTNSLVLKVSEAAHHEKRFHRSLATDTGLVLALLPKTATAKERIQDFIGEGNSFRIAFLKRESASSSSRKHILHYVDFAEMAGDTMPWHAFADSRGPDNTPFGANVPAWSPDGKTLAYEIGAENQTVNNVSRIWIQPLQGSRMEGPAFPATNPRFWSDGKADTSLVWCTSGREDGWKDTASQTLRRKFSGQALTGEALILSKGSYHGGLSGDAQYLASAFRHGVMKNLTTPTPRFFHIYPGHPPAKDGSNTDSLQSCNPSISPDPKRPSRMLFLDFGVPSGEAAYPNMVRPQHYAQHQMILIGDYLADAPGRIVDFVDSPADELAKGKTWDDPEWSNHGDFAVATTRDPVGDKTNPAEPKPSQPDIYIIHLPTKASLKVVSADHMTLPVLWIGKKN